MGNVVQNLKGMGKYLSHKMLHSYENTNENQTKIVNSIGKTEERSAKIDARHC